jgi:hypothetical protein
MNKPAPSAVAQTVQNLDVQMRSMEVEQWKYMVSRINDPTTAKVIVEYLQYESELKERYAGIYLRARGTVERFRVHQAKALKRAQLFARLGGWISRLGKQPKPEPLVWPKLNPF